MKKLLLVLTIFLFVPVNVSAHNLQTSNGLAAVLHADPNDTPTVNVNTNIYLEFANQFSDFVANCDCKVVIFSNKTKDVTTVPSKISNTALGFSVTFPQATDYTVKLTGKYNGELVSLNYNLTVVPQNYFSSFAAGLIGSGLVLVTITGLYFVFKRQSLRPNALP